MSEAHGVEPDSGPSYSIDELAAATGVPSRTIRFYQSKGALPEPERQGRVAVYRDVHVERLKLVAELQDRGLSLRAIRDMVGRAQRGDVSLREWIGIDDRVQTPWADDPPKIVTETELAELIGARMRPGIVAELVRSGLVERQGKARPAPFLIRSPKMLGVALRLEAAGVSFSAAGSAERIVRHRMARAADELVAHFRDDVARTIARGPDSVVGVLAALRPLGAEAVCLVFAQEMERAIGEVVERGGLASRRSRRRRGA